MKSYYDHHETIVNVMKSSEQTFILPLQTALPGIKIQHSHQPHVDEKPI